MEDFSRNRKFIYITILPTVAIVALIGFIPIIYSFMLSLQDYELLDLPSKYIGFKNYIQLLTDTRYLHSFTFTVLFALAATIIEMIIGFIIAYVLADKVINTRFSSAVRTLILVPYVVTPIVAAYIFKTLIYDMTFGYFNYFLRIFHLPLIDYMKGYWTPILAQLFMEVLLRSPFVIIIIYAGISIVPNSILEASEIDGANLKNRIFSIIVPYIKPILFVAFVFRFMDALKIFDELYVLTGGGPGFTTESISVWASASAFKFFHMGYVNAGTFLFLIFILIIVSVVLKIGIIKKD